MSTIAKNIIVILFLFFTLFFIAPTSSHAVFTDTGGGDHEGADWIITTDTIIAGTHTNIGTFQIDPGVTVTLETYSGGNYGSVDITATTGNIYGVLTGTGKGFPAGVGTGKGTNGDYGGGSGGGGYGGTGGIGNEGAAGGTFYGNVTSPDSMGSPGGSNNSAVGGSGGGFIKLTISGTLDVDGTISANGNTGGTSTVNYSGGGGSGGGINISAGTFSGDSGATITANGGVGPDPGNAESGGGGGGRIAIYYTTNSFSGSMLARGATGNAAGRDGSAGTIFTKASSPTYGDLIIDNNTQSQESITQLPTGSYTFESVTFQNNTRFTIQDGVSITASSSIITSGLFYLTNTSSTGTFTYPSWDLTITSGTQYILGGGTKWPIRDLTINGGTLYLSSSHNVRDVFIATGATLTQISNSTSHLYDLTLNVSGDMTVDGTLSANAAGYSGGSGTGTGASGTGTSFPSPKGAGGAGHGGTGGNGSGSPAPAGGTAYNSWYNPVLLGSGGGSNGASLGGSGGGYIHLNITGTLDLNGSITSNGGNGINPSTHVTTGGGSGGSINIYTSILTGSGSFTANGGSGGSGSNSDGGGGAGGIIYVRTPRSLFTGTYVANGGVGPDSATDGGAGSAIIQVDALVGYWKFNEGVGATANDNSFYRNNGNLINGASWTNNGKIGKAVNFDGTNDYIEVPDSTSLSPRAGLTVSAWIKRDTVNSIDAILGKYKSITNERSFELGMANTYPVFIISSDGVTATTLTATTAIDAGQWYYVAAVWDQTQIHVYVNGKRENSAAYTAGLYDNDEALRIGDADQSFWYYDGLIDEVKMYNYGLSASEIKTDFNEGKSLVLGAKSTESGTAVASSSDSRKYCVPGSSETCNSPVAEWLTNEGKATSIFDTSGNSNTGTLTNGPVWTSGRGSKAIEFDGTNDYIKMNNSASLEPSSALTISAWVKPNSTANGAILAKQAGTSTFDSYSLFYDGTTQKFNFYLGDSSATTQLQQSSTSTNNTWHHVEAIWDGTNVVMYVDGIYEGATTTSTIGHQNSNPVFMGAQGDDATTATPDTTYFKGAISNIKIYNYARTPAQVALDYSRGQPVVWYKFNECTGTSLYNAIRTPSNKPAGFNGTLTLGSLGTTSAGTCTGASGTTWKDGAIGKFGASIKFDGSDDYVSMGTGTVSTLVNNSTAVTTALWVKLNSIPTSGNQFQLVGSAIDSVAAGANDIKIIHTGVVSIGGRSVSGDSHQSTASTISLTPGQWYHIVQISDFTNDQLRLYINGTLNKTQSVSFGNSNFTKGTPSTTDQIGNYSGQSRYLNGQIDDVRIYNYALTATQIKQLVNNGAIYYE